ncbi:UNVERIFIED_CONTAM: putative acetyltransferase [Sesamum radiatum]|uniref:Acetyltransferase n=1 Tax=Sesamum radiatum TaxID=300843 RepID=A0AAW2M1W8_SESRA
MSQDQTPKIRILSKFTINAVPLTESIHRVNLTPWDLELLFLDYSQKGLLLRKPNPQQEATILSKTNTTSLIHHLKASLERTLHFFSPLLGRLATTKSDDGSTTCFFIDCDNINEKGALFIHATALDTNLSVADILDSSTYVPEIVPSFFPLKGTRNRDGVSQPLLAVQVTELVDGLFIGCSINHLLVDATSFWHFFNSWAEISRGDHENFVHDPISKLPILNRDQLTLDLVGSSDVKIYNEYLILDKVSAAHESPCLLRDRVFHFTKESVAKLKARANKEVVESKGQISSLQAVIAHVWRSIIRCRSAMNSGTQETTFEIPIGARQRLNPPLPEEYFGNSVFPGIVTTEAWKILENGLGWTSRQIHKMVASANGPDKVKEFYMSWIKKPNFLQFDGLPSNHFILINSPRFDVYGNDFGWGKPVAARSGRANSFDGRITIYGGFEKGSLEIEACLFPEALSALVNDAEFMEFVKSDF